MNAEPRHEPFELGGGQAEKRRPVGDASGWGDCATRLEPGEPVDVQRLAAELLGPHGRWRATLISNREIHALAEAVQDQTLLLAACALNDRSAPYAPGEARPSDGRSPEDAGAPGPRWLTPKDIVESAYAPPAPTEGEAG